MNASRFVAVSVLSLLATVATVAQADEADASQFAAPTTSQRTRAEVKAEAATVPRTRSQEPAGSRVLKVESNTDRAEVRALAAQALRLGRISYGEGSSM